VYGRRLAGTRRRAVERGYPRGYRGGHRRRSAAAAAGRHRGGV